MACRAKLAGVAVRLPLWGWIPALRRYLTADPRKEITVMSTFKIIAKATAPIRIEIATPCGAKGHFIGHARIRSKAENKALLDRFQNWDESDGDADESLIRELYQGFDGIGDENGELTGDAAFEAVLRGPLSAYLTPAVVAAYFEQYGDARVGNSGKRRWR